MVKKEYNYAIISGSIIFVGMIYTVFLYGELHPVIAAVGGLLFSIPIKFFWNGYTSPVLKIIGKEYRYFKPGNSLWKYKCYRIIVENTGESAAKNCKGYIVTKNGKERVCWTVPSPEGKRSTTTINKSDNERLDFCAFYISGPTSYTTSSARVDRGPEGRRIEKPRKIPKIIAPTEDGWRDPEKCRSLDGIKECKVLITADNAEPIGANIKFDTTNKEIKMDI